LDADYLDEMKQSRYPLRLYQKALLEGRTPWKDGGFTYFPGIYSGVVAHSCSKLGFSELVALRVLTPPGGWLSIGALETLASCAKNFGIELLQFTTGGTVQLFVLREKVLGAAAYLKQNGLGLGSTGNGLRVLTSCPGPRLCEHALFDAPDLAFFLGEYFAEDQQYPSFINKVKLGVSACPVDCLRAVSQKDIGLVGITDPKYGRGVSFYLGGKCGSRGKSGPMPGFLISPFLSLEDGYEKTAKFIENSLELWNDYGRHKERLGDFIDRCGVDWFRNKITAISA